MVQTNDNALVHEAVELEKYLNTFLYSPKESFNP
jgi:hypothetical protein